MRERTIPQSEVRIPREATLGGSDRRLPRPRHVIAPRPRHPRCGQLCWTPGLEDITTSITEEIMPKD